jgi:hypothetical protein
VCKVCLSAGGVCAVRSGDVAPPVEALGGASAALRAGTDVKAAPAAADVGDVGDVGENRTLCAYLCARSNQELFYLRKTRYCLLACCFFTYPHRGNSARSALAGQGAAAEAAARFALL